MKKKCKSEISRNTNKKAFHNELGTWITILEQSYSSNSLIITKDSPIIYFYDIEFICFIQNEYQMSLIIRKTKIIVLISL